MERAIRICPQPVPYGSGTEALKVVRHQVGLRASGGFGFQANYGMVNQVVSIVIDVLRLARGANL
ncbi:hypothetical protein BDY21DRAFT_350757 [Lineolata rhizophorae]|uniref:Uncharacterized protein n=1 Tax=Lineolata rhizophorae TaxID=578093 RepID=A0A6A6NV89_9PEZI|nr:hypothetical protein BDY21DRAFT_350757 [Lineolata rhizophorae]